MAIELGTLRSEKRRSLKRNEEMLLLDMEFDMLSSKIASFSQGKN
ncbi:hypothetical protein [Burkholderia sp. AU45251]|nr:hypothetical protein [Burkholderia sp. AU45251]MDN7514777.1 hypothetical protein [Burkholderia sp. AU45251]